MAAARLFAPTETLLVLYVVVATALTSYSTATNCPDDCTCSNSTGHVTCDGARFDSLAVFGVTSITKLDVTRCSIRRLSASFFRSGDSRLVNLVEMKLHQNAIERIEVDTFSGRSFATRLQILDLSENNIADLQPGVFSALRNLVHLDLAANHLTSIKRAFSGLSELVRLDLRSNQLTEIEYHSFLGLSALRYLRLDDNAINHVHPQAFSSLERLAYLAMKANPLGANDDVAITFNFNSPFLTYVDLSECWLTEIPRGLPSSVRYLQLRRNRLRILDSRSLADCSSDLNILVLDENEIETIENDALSSATQLQQIWLNGNRLESIPRPLPPRLEKLFIDSNRLRSLADDDLVASSTAVNESQLSVVSMMSNNISTVSSGAFRRLRQLESLDLSGNRIRRLLSGTFSKSNARLKTLSLSNNPIETLESNVFNQLNDLETLILSYISALDLSLATDAFASDLPSLRRLDLDSSPALVRRLLIDPDDERVVGCFRTVRDLAALESGLKSLPVDFFTTRFPDLTVLRMSSHSWHCDSRVVWLRNWLLSETTVHIDQPNNNFRCATPPEVANRLLTSLDDSEFVPSTVKLSAEVYRPAFQRVRSSSPLLPSTSHRHPTTSSRVNDVIESALTTTTTSRPMLDESVSTTWFEVLKQSFDDVKSVGIPLSSTASMTSLAVLEVVEAPYGESSTSEVDDDRHKGLTISLVTVFVTVLLVAILLTTIVYLCRKQEVVTSRSTVKAVPLANGNVAMTLVENGSTYGSSSTIDDHAVKHHVQWQDKVYFMAAGANGRCSPQVRPSVQCGCDQRYQSSSPGPVSSGTDETSMLVAATANNLRRELSPLPSSRDVKHKGLGRVYKWEDF